MIVSAHSNCATRFSRPRTPPEGWKKAYAIHTIGGGADGSAPTGGAPNQAGTYAAAFDQLLALEDISIVAAPGHSAYADYQNIRACSAATSSARAPIA